jgi:hypothetical protein
VDNFLVDGPISQQAMEKALKNDMMDSMIRSLSFEIGKDGPVEGTGGFGLEVGSSKDIDLDSLLFDF